MAAAEEEASADQADEVGRHACGLARSDNSVQRRRVVAARPRRTSAAGDSLSATTDESARRLAVARRLATWGITHGRAGSQGGRGYVLWAMDYFLGKILHGLLGYYLGKFDLSH